MISLGPRIKVRTLSLEGPAAGRAVSGAWRLATRYRPVAVRSMVPACLALVGGLRWPVLTRKERARLMEYSI